MASTRLLLLLVVVVGAAQAETSEKSESPRSPDEPLQINPDAEGVAEGGDTSARFLFKKNRRRNNHRNPYYDYNYYYYDYNNNNNGYDYSSQCRSCGYGAVDYTTARRCCQQGYSNCCFENNNGGEVKPGTCPYSSFGSVGSSYCRSECSGDTDCYGTQKCCSRGCSRVCQYPDSSSSYEKPGVCPFPGSGSSSYPSYPYYSGSGVGSTYCRRDCYSDRQCPGSQKCCENNCSATCVSPQYYY